MRLPGKVALSFQSIMAEFPSFPPCTTTGSLKLPSETMKKLYPLRGAEWSVIGEALDPLYFLNG
jgi:hypothetical protein